MAIKPVISVDIDPNDNLGKFYRRYQEYSAKIKELPESFTAAHEGAEKIVGSFENGIAAMLSMLEVSQRMTDQDRKRENILDKTTHHWRDAARWSKSFALNVKDASISLLKLAGIGSVLGGVVGYGGLLGLENLAGAGGAGRRATLGLGLSYGGLTAFNVGFGRQVNTGSFLGGVSEALGDVTKRVGLYRAGLTPEEMQGGTATVGVNLLRRIKSIVDRTNPEFLGQVSQIYGLGQFGLSVEDLRRIRATPISEENEYFRQFIANRATLQLSDKTLKKWQDLDVTLSKSKNVIETALIEGLHPLIPDLEKLSNSVANTIRTFLLSKEFKPDLEKFGHAIGNFAEQLGSKKFQSDLRDFAQNIAGVAQGLYNALSFLGLIPHKEKYSPKTGLPVNPTGPEALAWNLKHPHHQVYLPGAFNADPRRAAHWWDPGSWLDYHRTAPHGTRTYNSQLQAMGWSPLDAAAIQGNISFESGGDPYAVGDHGTSGGLAQWHRHRWVGLKRFEVLHAGQYKNEADAQLAYLTWELTRGPYKHVGDMLRRAKTLQQKVWVLDKYYENPLHPHGTYGRRLSDAASSIRAKADVNLKVKVHNQTGGQVNVNASQLPQ